jgi:hypothetical protein
LALVSVAVLPKRVLKKERVLASANIGKRGTRSTTKDALPTKRLKNKDFFGFFGKYGLTTEETSVLREPISLN